MRAFLFAALTLALTPAPLNAQKAQPPMPAGYDNAGPKPVNLLPAILDDLRNKLTDPYSIRDFRICEPKATTPKYNSYGAGEWMRSKWMVHFSLNAKNRMGGYAGRTAFLASYTDGRLDSVSSMSSLGSSLAHVNSRMVAETDACPRVPDAEVQRLLQEDGPAVGETERG